MADSDRCYSEAKSLCLISEVEGSVEVERIGELPFKGFQKPIPVFNVLGLGAAAFREHV